MKNYLAYLKTSTIFKLVIAIVISAILYWMSAFLLPILLAVGLAFALYPISDALTKVTFGKTGMHPSRVMAIILAFLTFIIFVFVVVVFIILPLFAQMNDLFARLPEYTAQLQSDSLNLISKGQMTFPLLPSSISSLVNDTLNGIMTFISGMVKNLLASTLQIVANLFGLIVVPFLAFYFLKDWRELTAMVVNVFNEQSRPKAQQVLSHIGRAVSAYVSGLWKLSLLAGFCITIVLLIAGVKYPLVFGFLAMVAETIPVIGPLIAAVPAIFIAYSFSPQSAMWLTVFYLLYYTLDGQVFTPIIMGKQIDLHPVIIIVALLISAKLFGIIGMPFALPVAAVYRVLYKELWHDDSFDMVETPADKENHINH
jgi:predicted PurR-regulated permease PerM